jgi:para-aminobenzoate synthetase component 1
MLPAGSICGAPKKRTLEIITEAEGERRGFYTGVAGVFDGRDLDSGVLIRFIEQTPSGELRFRSGGGITAKSDARSEYDELIQKVYVPIYRNHSR